MARRDAEAQNSLPPPQKKSAYRFVSFFAEIVAEIVAEEFRKHRIRCDLITRHGNTFLCMKITKSPRTKNRPASSLPLGSGSIQKNHTKDDLWVVCTPEPSIFTQQTPGVGGGGF